MKKLNPIEKSQYINNRYKEYLKSSFQFGKSYLQNLFLEQLEKEKLFKGPYVDLSFPFERGNNIESLIHEGIVCKSFKRLNDVNFIRPLYSHQEEAIRTINKGHSAVITTGTGSGKTESFLYPILNDLLFDVEKGNQETGVRAIFLYPMNALLNDQIDRIRKMLMYCPEITFGFFTSDTPEKANANTRKKLSKENNVEIPDNELVSREEIRNNPPHLLFTNYSMLEYLLIRPNDYAIFEEERLKNWKYVVLDEAHTYNGSKGIELSLLLRRLTGLAPKLPQFILTSATLGQQGKSESDIIKFAENLTSAKYDVSDIIFSKRIPLQKKAEYRVKGSDYTSIKNNIDSIKEIKSISQEYYNCNSSNIKEILFELLSRDKNVHELSNLLKEGSKEFNVIYNNFYRYMSKEELIALIDIINMTEKDGIGLFDLKYHSFVRPLSGAYITYGKEPKLSLTKTNEIDGMKAFEVGNCRYCSSIYIIGKIKRKEDEQMDYLLQNKEVDIYENYGNDQHVKIDYFLLENAVNDEEVENDILEEYSVCAKCGEIHVVGNLNARKCKCGEDYRFTVYRVEQKKCDKDDSIYNNISQCPCCGHRGSSGVVKALNIGKDEGTALIAQILYEAIDEGEDEENQTKKLSFKPINKIESKKKVKQYLAFSDSRQQASFAALFFDSNHVRMLRKRLIWEIIVKNKYNNISLDEMASYLTELIKKKDLFKNNMTHHKNAWAAILVDLLKVDGAYDSENLGLYYFDLDIYDKLDELSDEDIKEEFKKYKCMMNKEELITLMQVILEVFKVTPAINYVKSTLTPEEKMDVLEYRRFDNYVMLNCSKSEKNIRSLLPVTGKENIIIRYIKKIFGCTSEDAKKVIESVFNLLLNINEIYESEKFLIKNEKKDAYQINASRYVIKNYMNSKFYQCNKCGRLTPYNLRGKCTRDRCTGTLLEVNPDEVLSSNFYRNQYKEKKIESIVIKEHTAQLDRKKAKEYQVAFKDKDINILSCSTTFEMGIDIGGLETVFMRNVPPTPANYVQRAGRAGRRKNSSAYILTYCGVGSHDYTYFSEPEKMISGIINPPCFNILNKKIILRHLMATSLGYFFRKYPDMFKNLDVLVIKNNSGVDKFKKYMLSHPSDLNNYINNKIIPESRYDEYKDFKWIDEMGGEDEKMSRFVDAIREIVNDYKIAKEQAVKEDRGRDSDYYKKQIELIKKQDVLQSLTKYCVIPKYGFPVDVVDLQIYENGIPINKYDMNRDLKVAISEYAPDSEVIVDKNKYTSKYITLNKNHEFTRNWFVTCPTCKKTNIFLTKQDNTKCKYCGQDIEMKNAEYYIEPIYGFKSGETKESTRLKPKRSYSGEVTYVGGGKLDEKRLVIGNTIGVETSSDDELLIMNKNGFYMCPICGYSDILKQGHKVPVKQKKHKNFKQYDCPNDKLEFIHLGHKFETDVARFTIPLLESSEKTSYPQALSFLYAFLDGVSIALGIERTDIDGVLELNLDMQSYDILLYDNVPGGAGHVKRLLNKDAIVSSLKAGLNRVSKECCDKNTSCYNCLRNYYNQFYHNKLVRKLAINIIKRILFEIDDAIDFYQLERWNGNSYISTSNNKKKLILGNDGRNPGIESADEIWDDLLEDCFYENETSIIKKLKENSPKSIEKPYYRKTVKIEEIGKSFTSNLIWIKNQVILFLDDAYNDYLIAKESGWNVYCTKEGFDVDELLENIGE